jgi:HSP20 family protein
MPPVDVYEEGEAVVVKAELPGLKKEEVDIQIAGDVVTISGKKEKEEKVEKKDYYRYERESGSFSRSVALPAKVQAEKATAELKDGVLLLRAPKAEGVATSSLKIDVT